MSWEVEPIALEEHIQISTNRTIQKLTEENAELKEDNELLQKRLNGLILTITKHTEDTMDRMMALTSDYVAFVEETSKRELDAIRQRVKLEEENRHLTDKCRLLEESQAQHLSGSFVNE